MSNPARELHNVISGWRSILLARDGQQSIYNARATDEGPASTMKAFGLLQLVEAHIDSWEEAGHDVAVHRRSVEVITRSLLAFPHTWQKAISAEQAHPQASLDALEMIAQLIDFSKVEFIPPLAEVRLAEFVGLIQDTLADDETLPSIFRSYISTLITAIGEAMSHRDADRLKEELEHLWIAVFAAEEVSEHDGKWKDIANRFGWDTFTQTVASIIGGVATKMITGG